MTAPRRPPPPPSPLGPYSPVAGPSNTLKRPLPPTSVGSADSIDCICGYTHDDLYTICCDSCGKWYHVRCMFQDGRVDEANTWFCPRVGCNGDGVGEMEVERARKGQEQWLKEQPKGKPGGKGKRRRVEGSSARLGDASTPTPPPPSAHSMTPGLHPLPPGFPDALAFISSESHYYTQLTKDVLHPFVPRHTLFQSSPLQLPDDHPYSRPWLPLRLPTRAMDPSSFPHPNITVYSSSAPWSPTSSPTYSIHTTVHIPPNSFIAPHLSTITPARTFLDSNPSYSLSGLPPAHTHTIGPPLNIVLDARTRGSPSRWTRRGCHPNAVIGRYLDGVGGVGFGLFSTTSLEKGEEVIVGWEWDDNSAVHSLPRLIVEPGSFPPRVIEHRRRQFMNILYSLSDTFERCACSDPQNCTIHWMHEFIHRHSPDAIPKPPESEPPDLGPLISPSLPRGFATKERVWGGGGVAGAVLDCSVEERFVESSDEDAESTDDESHGTDIADHYWKTSLRKRWKDSNTSDRPVRKPTPPPSLAPTTSVPFSRSASSPMDLLADAASTLPKAPCHRRVMTIDEMVSPPPEGGKMAISNLIEGGGFGFPVSSIRRSVSPVAPVKQRKGAGSAKAKGKKKAAVSGRKKEGEKMLLDPSKDPSESDRGIGSSRRRHGPRSRRKTIDAPPEPGTQDVDVHVEVDIDVTPRPLSPLPSDGVVDLGKADRYEDVDVDVDVEVVDVDMAPPVLSPSPAPPPPTTASTNTEGIAALPTTSIVKSDDQALPPIEEEPHAPLLDSPALSPRPADHCPDIVDVDMPISPPLPLPVSSSPPSPPPTKTGEHSLGDLDLRTEASPSHASEEKTRNVLSSSIKDAAHGFIEDINLPTAPTEICQRESPRDEKPDPAQMDADVASSEQSQPPEPLISPSLVTNTESQRQEEAPLPPPPVAAEEPEPPPPQPKVKVSLKDYGARKKKEREERERRERERKEKEMALNPKPTSSLEVVATEGKGLEVGEGSPSPSAQSPMDFVSTPMTTTWPVSPPMSPLLRPRSISSKIDEKNASSVELMTSSAQFGTVIVTSTSQLDTGKTPIALDSGNKLSPSSPGKMAFHPSSNQPPYSSLPSLKIPPSPTIQPGATRTLPPQPRKQQISPLPPPSARHSGPEMAQPRSIPPLPSSASSSSPSTSLFPPKHPPSLPPKPGSPPPFSSVAWPTGMGMRGVGRGGPTTPHNLPHHSLQANKPPPQPHQHLNGKGIGGASAAFGGGGGREPPRAPRLLRGEAGRGNGVGGGGLPPSAPRSMRMGGGG